MGRDVMLECSRGKGVFRERRDVRDSVWWKAVGGERRDVTDVARGKGGRSGETFFLQPVKGEMGR